MSTTNQQKFENTNPLQQWLIDRFQRRMIEILRPINPTDLLEVGCGEGYLLHHLTRAFPSINMLGLDNNRTALEEGRRLFSDLHFEFGDIYHLPLADASRDVTIVSEVLEHLERPADAMGELMRITKRSLVLSVPNEPWFRLSNLARGRHLARWGNHPEHLNLWSTAGFKQWLGQFSHHVEIAGSFPWTIAVIRL